MPPKKPPGVGGLIELAGVLEIEAETGEVVLHVATLRLVEAERVFGDLRGFFGEGRGIAAGTGNQLAGRSRRAVPGRGDAGQRNHREGANPAPTIRTK